MSSPRPIIPGKTYMVTRRCTQREYLLKPSPSLEQLILYCLAISTRRSGVVVHALTVMSNHYHLIATDPSGRLPEMCHWLHEFIAKAVNARLGRWENFWSSEPPSYVQLVGPDDVLAKTVYALANPVVAGLVSHGEQWPGIRIFSPGLRRIARPAGFFRENGPTPEVATLTIVAPPIGLSSHQAYRRVLETVAEEEARVRESFRAQGRTFLGARRVLAQRHDESPHSHEPRRTLSPTIACRNKWLRIETLQRCKQFVIAYRDALKRWARAARDVVFPAGTYALARRYGVLVAPS